MSDAESALHPARQQRWERIQALLTPFIPPGVERSSLIDAILDAVAAAPADGSEGRVVELEARLAREQSVMNWERAMRIADEARLVARERTLSAEVNSLRETLAALRSQ